MRGRGVSKTVFYGRPHVGKNDYLKIMNNFRELWYKDGIKWKNDDNLIEYNQVKSFKFLPSESNGKLRDQVTVPNIPMIVSCIQI